MRRRIMASVGGKALPYDAEVEWLESDGDAYINTGIADKNGWKAVIDWIPGMVSAYQKYFGTTDNEYASGASFVRRNGTSGVTIEFWRGNTSVNAYYWGGTKNLSSRMTSEISCIRNDSYMNLDKNSEYGNAKRTIYGGSDASTLPIFVFGCNLTGIKNGTCFRVYSLKLETAGGIMMELVPVRFTNSSGQDEGAFYDSVSRRMLMNAAGRGAFIIGPDKT